MQFFPTLALAAILLPSPPAPEAPQDPVETQKIQLRFVETTELLPALLKGNCLADLTILGYPLDNSLIVRGPEDRIQAFKVVVRVVDAPVQGNNTLVLKLFRAAPEAVRRDALLLSQAGSVTAEGPGLSFRGPRPWLAEVRELVARAELTAAGLANGPSSSAADAIPLARFGTARLGVVQVFPEPGALHQVRPAEPEVVPGLTAPVPGVEVATLTVKESMPLPGPRPAPAAQPTRLLIPAGQLTIRGDNLVQLVSIGEARAEGYVTLTWNGGRLELYQARVTIAAEGNRGGYRVTIQPLAEPGR
jgi:hypothetical protein